MKVSTLIVIGEPLTCGIADCYEPASVVLRQVDAIGDDAQLLYCETCWIAARHAYAPLVARDEAQAVDGALALVRKKARPSHGE